MSNSVANIYAAYVTEVNRLSEIICNLNSVIDGSLDPPDHQEPHPKPVNVSKMELKITNTSRILDKYILDNSPIVIKYMENKRENEFCGADVNHTIDGAGSTAAHNPKLDIFKSLVGSDCEDEDEGHWDAITADPITASYSNIGMYNRESSQKFTCLNCNAGEMILSECDGIIICNSCGITCANITDNERPSYKEIPKEASFYAYKRINHFREILTQFQAKESTVIDDCVIDKIKIQIKRERLVTKNLTNKKTKEILKQLGLNKYYEHIPFIKSRLGITPQSMDPELETTLCDLFVEIQQPYAKHCPADRVNFLNYYYTLYKLCELLDQMNFLPHFPMLKDKHKLREQDAVWEKICMELGWMYIPTIYANLNSGSATQLNANDNPFASMGVIRRRGGGAMNGDVE
jgi:hypothetical protein